MISSGLKEAGGGEPKQNPQNNNPQKTQHPPKKTNQKNPEGKGATEVHPNSAGAVFPLRSFGKSRQKHTLQFVSEDLVTHWICWDNLLQPCSRFPFLMHLGDFRENL